MSNAGVPDVPLSSGAVTVGRTGASGIAADQANYRDYSTYIEEGGEIVRHKKSDTNFPAKLHKIISTPDFAHIIAWMPHGRAWKILNKELLMTEIAVVYFNQTKFPSFSRQLSNWGFKRLHQSGPDSGCYYHEMFLRGIPRLTVLMQTVQPRQGKPAPSEQGEPDLYRISNLYPLPAPPISSGRKNHLEPTEASAKGKVVAAAALHPVSNNYTPGYDLSKKQNSTTTKTQEANFSSNSSAKAASASIEPPANTKMPQINVDGVTSGGNVPSVQNSSMSSIAKAETLASSSSMHYIPSFETGQDSSIHPTQEHLTSSSARAVASSTHTNPHSFSQTPNAANAQEQRTYGLLRNLHYTTGQDQSLYSAREPLANSPACAVATSKQMNYRTSDQMPTTLRTFELLNDPTMASDPMSNSFASSLAATPNVQNPTTFAQSSVTPARFAPDSMVASMSSNSGSYLTSAAATNTNPQSPMQGQPPLSFHQQETAQSLRQGEQFATSQEPYEGEATFEDDMKRFFDNFQP